MQQPDNIYQSMSQYFNVQIPDKTPFRYFLNFDKLIEFWQQGAEQGNVIAANIYQNFIKPELDKNPDLCGPIEDITIIEKNPKFLDILMSGIFSASSWETEIASANLPFSFEPFYKTPVYEKILSMTDCTISNFNSDSLIIKSIIHTYEMILKQHFNIDPQLDYPMVFHIKDHVTGFIKCYQLQAETSFMEAKQLRQSKELSEQDINFIKSNFHQLDKVMKLIPPEDYEIHGFVVIRCIDITDRDILSSLKQDLLDSQAIIHRDGFLDFQDKVRALLNKPEIMLNIAALRDNEVMLLHTGAKLNKQCIFNDSLHYNYDYFKGSVYEQAVSQRQPTIIADISKRESLTPAEQELVKKGVKNLLAAPLYHDDKVVGVLSLYSPNPNDLTIINTLKLTELYPVLGLTIKRSLEGFENRISSIIQQQCTAIHPSVYWRFREAAYNHINKSVVKNEQSEMEPIIFDKVYPLYSATDIRGSSTFRNIAIKDDLVAHLNMARNIIGLANAEKPLPVLDEMIFRIDQNLHLIQDGLASGDEISIINFLKKEIEPAFNDLDKFSSQIHKIISEYRSIIDSEEGTLYQKRKEFDDSVSLVNKTMSAFIDNIQPVAQAMFPHYFDKNTTDGVDQNIYIGSSLVNERRFDLLYLKNLRLWQLIIMCELAMITENLKAEMPLPLDTTHLIVVQDMPISIRFRYDEKRFAVDGAYNIRYEIMKKRIDKAVIKSTGERLTQPGKIAIVYTQPSEAHEYRRYIEYLHAKDYLDNDIEELILEDLQGIHGLHALRVDINLKRRPSATDVLQQLINQAFQE